MGVTRISKVEIREPMKKFFPVTNPALLIYRNCTGCRITDKQTEIIHQNHLQ